MPTVPSSLRREPLVVVLALGTLLFGLHRLVAPPEDGREIVVTEALRGGLRQEHQRRTGTAPSPEEEQALLERWLDEEIRYREALRLGLDRGDVIVRRRLVQKMEFLTEDLEPVREPTDDELAAHLAAHPERWAEPERVTIEHVFAGRERHGAAAVAVATGWRDALQAGADPATVGDPFLRGREFVRYTAEELSGVFGPGFSRAVAAFPVGPWSGPVPSSYGVHLVRVRERREARPPDLGAVRAAVRRDWMAAERARLDREAMARVRAGYVVRMADEPGGTARAAERP